jgi:hypothetical protein
VPNCFLVHGWGGVGNREYGRNHVDKLGPLVAARGWTIKQFDWDIGYFSWHPVYMWHLGSRLAAQVRPGDMAIGNSTGASIIYEALKRGAPFRLVILTSPNLMVDPNFPRNGYLEKITVWHAPSDPVVKSARRGATFLPGSPWGAMGAYGYQGGDPRVTNYDKEHDFAISAAGHADVFATDVFSYWGPLIVNDVPYVR